MRRRRRNNPVSLDDYDDVEYSAGEVTADQELLRGLPADLGKLSFDELTAAIAAADRLEELVTGRYGETSAQGIIDRGELLRSERRHRRRSPRQNPEPSDAALRAAVGVYEGFHAYDSDEVGMLDINIPASLLYGGPCTWVTYASDKWEDRSHDYIHTITSQPRVFCGLAGAGAGRRRKVPDKIRKTTVVAQLGLRALGFAFMDPDGEELEVKCPRGTRWFWSPQGKALLAVEKKKRLLAIIWGGKLDVEPRGIVG